jgi:putative FmdB family regulatory protein
MPTYEFVCATCGPFEVRRGVAQAHEPAHCPACRAPARRVYTPPGIARTPAWRKKALSLEEKSAHEPDVVATPSGRPLPAVGHRSHSPPWVLGH